MYQQPWKLLMQLQRRVSGQRLCVRGCVGGLLCTRARLPRPTHIQPSTPINTDACHRAWFFLASVIGTCAGFGPSGRTSPRQPNPLLISITRADIDECAPNGGLGPCSTDATCINTAGSYTCRCDKGFAGGGLVCTGVKHLHTAAKVLCVMPGTAFDDSREAVAFAFGNPSTSIPAPSYQ